MKNLFTLCLVLFSMHIFSQNQSGLIEFDRTVYWTKVQEELPFLSQEEKDRTKYTWGKNDGYTTQMVLKFNSNKSLYQTSENQKNRNNQWNWRNDEVQYFADFESLTRQDIVELPDRIYRVEGELPKYKWKILSDIKDIQGYVCMSASLYDSVRNHKVVAWFTPDIPISTGPEMWSGLPGMILEVDIQDGACVIAATKISMDPHIQLQAPARKKKQKVISRQKMKELEMKHIKEFSSMRRNPYWNLRY